MNKTLTLILSILIMMAIYINFQLQEDKKNLIAESNKLDKEMQMAIEELNGVYNDVQLHIEHLNVIYKTAEKYNLEPELALAIMKVESNFDTNAVNNTSQGLMQVNSLYHTGNLFDLRENVECSFSLLSDLESESNNLHEILGKYNRGKGGYKKYVAKTGQAVTSYSTKVITLMNELKNY